MVAAVSQDGFITRGEETGASQWVSPEDKIFFRDIRSKHPLVIMGSRTFDALSTAPSPSALSVVLTHHPENYADRAVPNQLTFQNLTPVQFMQQYAHYDSCLLLGGSQIYESFLVAGLVDEMYLTQEPIMHTSGTPLLRSGKDLSAYVHSAKPTTTTLNQTGTTLLHYTLK